MTGEITSVLASYTHIMSSEQTGRTYRITVSLPLAYDAPEGSAWPFHNNPPKWRTVYVLDGNWYADMVTGMIRPVSLCGGITDAIVVGIGYPEADDPKEAFLESFTRRDHDLTPIYDEATETSMSEQHKRPVPNGDASRFLGFIQQELIPFVETTYHSDPSKRILAGHSYGGLFGLFTLFKSPSLFTAYIVGSPYLAYGDRVLFQQEEAFAQANTKLDANVYVYVAEHEEFVDDTTLTDTIRFAVLLQSREYEGLTLVRRIFDDENHCEVVVPGFHWGLKQALKS